MNVKVVAVFQGQYSSWNPMHDIEVLYLRDSNELMMIANANCEYPNHYDLNDEWYDPICELAEDLNHMASIQRHKYHKNMARHV